LLVFGIFWCSFVAVFDFLILGSFIPQVASTWFHPTAAHIIKSELKSTGDGHGVDFEYTYSVAGTQYVGTRYTFDKSTSSDGAWARKAIRDYAAGSESICYYDPLNPARAVLSPGIHGSDVTMLMFITPFNIVGMFFIAAPISNWRNRRRPRSLAPRAVDRMRNREHYSMNNFSPVSTFFPVFLLTSFLGIFAVVFPSGFHPSLEKVVTIWGTGFLIAVVAAVVLRRRINAGLYDLVIDRDPQTISIPAMHKRAARELLPIAEISKITSHEVRTRSGEDEKVTWHVTLHTRDNREILLRDPPLQDEAELLAETLNSKLGLTQAAPDARFRSSDKNSSSDPLRSR
jgi:hypothetical protein